MCIQRTATKVVKGLEEMPHEEQLRAQVCLVWRRRLRGDLTSFYSFLRRVPGEEDGDLFSPVSSDKIFWNGSKLHQQRFRPDIRKYFFN